MDIDGTFLPVAKELIDSVFPTTVAYLRNNGGSYDPTTGDVTQDTTQFDINAGVLSRGRLEEGGVGESQELRLWIHHGTGGLPHLPTTSDQVEYGGLTWKVVAIDPTYSSKGLIASKIIARAD
jgi:hypothetical protein